MAGDYSHGQLLLGDPDEFAQEMIKLINDKEFRLIKWVSQMKHIASREPYRHVLLLILCAVMLVFELTPDILIIYLLLQIYIHILHTKL